jgi:hypothetical protein
MCLPVGAVVKLACGSATGMEGKELKDILTGRVWWVALKIASIGDG